MLFASSYFSTITPQGGAPRTSSSSFKGKVIAHVFDLKDRLPGGHHLESAQITNKSFYVSGNLRQPIDSGPKDTVFTLTPGFRTHLGANWYLLGGVEVPVTSPKAFDFQVLGGLMKVF